LNSVKSYEQSAYYAKQSNALTPMPV